MAEIPTAKQFAMMSPAEIEDIVDKGLRHKTRSQPIDYLKHWISVGRNFAYATQDDSWGEFEKQFTIIIKRLVVAERDLAAIKLVLERKP